MSRTTAEMTSELESFVDEFGVQAVLRALEEISYAKAEHLRSAWQDPQAAGAWARAAAVLHTVSNTASVVRVSP